MIRGSFELFSTRKDNVVPKLKSMGFGKVYGLIDLVAELSNTHMIALMSNENRL